MHEDADFRLVGDLSQPLGFGAAILGVCVDWTDYSAACGCCASLHCDRRVRHPLSHQSKVSLQDTFPTCISHTRLWSDRDGVLYTGTLSSRRSLGSLVAKAEYSSIGLMCWQTLHRYADTQSNFYHYCGWRRAMSAAATLKRVFSAFFSTAYFETL
jgi:hypothetical protein